MGCGRYVFSESSPDNKRGEYSSNGCYYYRGGRADRCAYWGGEGGDQFSAVPTPKARPGQEFSSGGRTQGFPANCNVPLIYGADRSLSKGAYYAYNGCSTRKYGNVQGGCGEALSHHYVKLTNQVLIKNALEVLRLSLRDNVADNVCVFGGDVQKAYFNYVRERAKCQAKFGCYGNHDGTKCSESAVKSSRTKAFCVEGKTVANQIEDKIIATGRSTNKSICRDAIRRYIQNAGRRRLGERLDASERLGKVNIEN